MKNVIKKTCAIVMMTAILFTTVAPTSVSAACSHGRRGPVEEYYYKYMGSSPCSGKSGCTVYAYMQYKITKRCMDCNAILVEAPTGKTYTEHSIFHK